MRITVHIGVRPQTLSAQGYQSLCSIYPPGKSNNLFVCDIPADCKEARQIIAFLESQGLQPYHTSARGRYGCQYHRIYDEADFAVSPNLAMFPKEPVELGRGERDEQGRAILDPMRGWFIGHDEHGRAVTDTTDLPPEFAIGFGRPGGTFVAESLKRRIEAEGFLGPRFKETVWTDALRAFRRERVWEITSSVVLPKLANVHQLVHARKEVFAGDYSRPIWVREPPFAHGAGEFHYRESELRSVQPFDLARTFEFHRKRDHTTIASQRFYKFCCELNLPIRWQPVRIDPG